MKYWKLKIIFNALSKILRLRWRFIFYYEAKTPSDYDNEFIDFELINIKFSLNGYLINNQEVIIHR